MNFSLPKNYKGAYRVAQEKYRDGECFIEVDFLKDPIGIQKNYIITDIDDTLMNTAEFKSKVNAEFASAFPLLSPNLWLTSYSQAKNSAGKYDFEEHIRIITSLTGGTVDVAKLYLSIVKKVVPNLIHQGFLKKLQDLNKQHSLVFMTQGAIDFQRLKVAAIIQAAHIRPEKIYYLENTKKGFVTKLFVEAHEDYREIHFFDDRVDELESIEALQFKNINLYRVQHGNGAYREQKIHPSSSITEIVFTQKASLID